MQQRRVASIYLPRGHPPNFFPCLTPSQNPCSSLATLSITIVFLGRFAELERSLGEGDRARAIYELAIAQPLLDMPEAIWKVGWLVHEGQEGCRRRWLCSSSSGC